MTFDEAELNFLLEAIVRFKQDIGMWGYVVPKGKDNIDLTRKYTVALTDLEGKIMRHLDGDDNES